MIDSLDLRALLSSSRDVLLSTLSSITTDICALHTEISLAESAEIEARVDGWLNSRETTIKGREWAATTNAASARQTLVDRKADLAIRTEEKWFVVRLLDEAVQ